MPTIQIPTGPPIGEVGQVLFPVSPETIGSMQDDKPACHPTVVIKFLCVVSALCVVKDWQLV
jgi:hypothetical protein